MSKLNDIGRVKRQLSKKQQNFQEEWREPKKKTAQKVQEDDKRVYDTKRRIEILQEQKTFDEESDQ